MRVEENGAGVLVEYLGDFSPELIFECGQCFRWNREESGGYVGVAFGKAARVLKTDGGFLISGGVRDFEEVWAPYFDLERDYGGIRRRIAVDDFSRRAAEFGTGIRILRQDKWEALCSFIISQCNNIPRIKGIVERLCESFGGEIAFEGKTLHAFPRAEELAGLSKGDLAGLRCGYRDEYILEAARACSCKGYLDFLSELETPELRKELKKLPGVGDKVANCVLLFGFNRLEAFPMDVWMRRAVSAHYGGKFCPEDVFGEFSGVAQQYIFHFARQSKIV